MCAQKSPAQGEALLCVVSADRTSAQWPKNSHSRTITGIGTPNNQSKIPLPIAKPPRFLAAGTTWRRGHGSLLDRYLGRSARDEAYQWPVFCIELQGSAGGFGSPFCNSSIECRS